MKKSCVLKYNFCVHTILTARCDSKAHILQSQRNLEILKREYGFRGEREKKGEKENEREEKG